MNYFAAGHSSEFFSCSGMHKRRDFSHAGGDRLTATILLNLAAFLDKSFQDAATRNLVLAVYFREGFSGVVVAASPKR